MLGLRGDAAGGGRLLREDRELPARGRGCAPTIVARDDLLIVLRGLIEDVLLAVGPAEDSALMILRAGVRVELRGAAVVDEALVHDGEIAELVVEVGRLVEQH